MQPIERCALRSSLAFIAASRKSIIVDSIRPFHYRSRRIPTGFPVDFSCHGQIMRGICVNVSDDGLCAEMESATEPGSTGPLTLRPSGRQFQVTAEAVSVADNRTAFAFCFQSDWEHEKVAELITSLAPVRKLSCIRTARRAAVRTGGPKTP